jgi:uncharacterized membrane protein|tara:strand:+ start:4177 stop:4380 length:204 start_codon:yes stop_codon:yes gene_type:complete
MTTEKEVTDKVEKAEDLVEEVLEELEDLGLVDEATTNKILAKVALYKRYILIAVPVVIALVAAISAL